MSAIPASAGDEKQHRDRAEPAHSRDAVMIRLFLFAEGDHRIHSGRSARGYQGRDHARRADEHHDRRVRRDVRRRDAEEEAPQQSRHRNRAGDTHRQADHRQYHALPHHERKHSYNVFDDQPADRDAPVRRFENPPIFERSQQHDRAGHRQ